MGIQGLLPLLKSIERPVHLKDYAGKTLAVDGYVWLHKGAFSCAQELCLGQPTNKYASFSSRFFVPLQKSEGNLIQLLLPQYNTSHTNSLQIDMSRTLCARLRCSSSLASSPMWSLTVDIYHQRHQQNRND